MLYAARRLWSAAPAGFSRKFPSSVFSCSLSYVRIHTRSKTLCKILSDVDFLVGKGMVKILRISVNRQEINISDFRRYHVVYCVLS